MNIPTRIGYSGRPPNLLDDCIQLKRDVLLDKGLWFSDGRSGHGIRSRDQSSSKSGFTAAVAVGAQPLHKDPDCVSSKSRVLVQRFYDGFDCHRRAAETPDGVVNDMRHDGIPPFRFAGQESLYVLRAFETQGLLTGASHQSMAIRSGMSRGVPDFISLENTARVFRTDEQTRQVRSHQPAFYHFRISLHTTDVFPGGWLHQPASTPFLFGPVAVGPGRSCTLLCGRFLALRTLRWGHPSVRHE